MKLKLPAISRRKVVVTVALLGVFAGLIAWAPLQSHPSDEQVYQQLLREFNWGNRCRVIHWSMPDAVARLLPLDHLESAFGARLDRIIDELVRRGLFTNAILPIPSLPPAATNEAAISAEADRRLTNGPTPFRGFRTYSVSSTNLRITCLTSELPLAQAAINRP